MGRKAAIYTRISRLAGRERHKAGAGLGVTRQQQDCQALAGRLGWDVTGVYVDDDTSAYAAKPRKDYNRLLADIEAGHVDAVLSWHTDRLHRSPAELETYIDLCQPRDVTTHTVKAGDIDLSTPSGRMIARQLGVMARYEVEHMAERQQREKTQAAAAGRWLGGRRPFGYQADGVTIEPDEAAEIIKATDDMLAGVSLHAITRDLNDRRVRTTLGNQWRHTNVARMLARPRNAGIMVHKGREVGPAAWPAIVSEDKLRAAQSLLSDPGRRTTDTGGTMRKYLGSGIYLCGVCADGTTLRGSGAGGGGGRPHVPSYRCRVGTEQGGDGKHLSRAASIIDAYVEECVVQRLALPDAREWLAGPKVDTAALRSERSALRQRLDDLARQVGQLMDLRSYGIAKAEAQTRLAEIDAELDRAATSSAAAKLLAADDMGAAWDDLDLLEKRDILAGGCVVTVHHGGRGRKPDGGYFDPDTVTVDFR